jgi:hypothetical protein
MTAPKPKPLGTSLDVPEGAIVIRPGDDSAAGRVISGGVYVLDVPGEHVVDGKTIVVSADADPDPSAS